MYMLREWTQRDWQKLWSTGNLTDRKNEVVSPKNLERWNIYSYEWKRSQDRRVEQSKAMEYGSPKASSDVLKPRNIHIYIYIWILLIVKLHKKRQIRVIMGSSSRHSCRELFKNLEVLPRQFQYIFSLLLFVVKNRELFRSNSDIYNSNTRYYNYPLQI